MSSTCSHPRKTLIRRQSTMDDVLSTTALSNRGGLVGFPQKKIDCRSCLFAKLRYLANISHLSPSAAPTFTTLKFWTSVTVPWGPHPLPLPSAPPLRHKTTSLDRFTLEMSRNRKVAKVRHCSNGSFLALWGRCIKMSTLKVPWPG